jgi:hypothetical protein
LANVNVILINLPGFEEGMPDLAAQTSLPILQDTAEKGTAKCYGASKWYVYVIDAEGVPRYVHYQIDLSAERDRLMNEIATVAAGGGS